MLDLATPRIHEGEDEGEDVFSGRIINFIMVLLDFELIYWQIFGKFSCFLALDGIAHEFSGDPYMFFVVLWWYAYVFWIYLRFR